METTSLLMLVLWNTIVKSSVIRPTETTGAAMGALKFLTAMGLFIGQSSQFFELLRDLAEGADDAEREDKQ